MLRFKDLVDQFNHRTHTVDKFAEGRTRFMQGFVKKVFIADTPGRPADHCFAPAEPDHRRRPARRPGHTAQLYFDFSGYSDMATASARPDDGLPLHGELQPALHQPVDHRVLAALAHQPVDLAARLPHISLGGNRGSTFQTYRNLFLTMLLGGLWHGANFTYIIWGAWHGMWLAIERASE